MCSHEKSFQPSPCYGWQEKILQSQDNKINCLPCVNYYKLKVSHSTSPSWLHESSAVSPRCAPSPCSGKHSSWWHFSGTIDFLRYTRVCGDYKSYTPVPWKQVSNRRKNNLMCEDVSFSTSQPQVSLVIINFTILNMNWW